MGPKSCNDAADQDLFRMELVNLIDQRHELVKLAALIDWRAFNEAPDQQDDSALQGGSSGFEPPVCEDEAT